eukprot:3359256-Rhodomonas_salina.1
MSTSGSEKGCDRPCATEEGGVEGSEAAGVTCWTAMCRERSSVAARSADTNAEIWVRKPSTEPSSLRVPTTVTARVAKVVSTWITAVVVGCLAAV